MATSAESLKTALKQSWRGSAESVVDLHPADFLWSTAVAVAGGVEVGYGRKWGEGHSVEHALAWSGTKDSYVDLQQFVPIGYESSNAFGIDERGNIIGVAYNSGSDLSRACMWVPVPEPMTIALMLGLCGMISQRARNCRKNLP